MFRPANRHDDMVDALSYAVAVATGRAQRSIPRGTMSLGGGLWWGLRHEEFPP
jgi:hypothetical protein